jgi:VanZ family protein
MPLESGNPLYALKEMLTKLVLFGLIGAIVATARPGKNARSPLIAATIGWLASAVFEAGQTWTPNHSPSITDVLLGGFGAFAGAWIAGRVMIVNEEQTW